MSSISAQPQQPGHDRRMVVCGDDGPARRPASELREVYEERVTLLAPVARGTQPIVGRVPGSVGGGLLGRVPLARARYAGGERPAVRELRVTDTAEPDEEVPAAAGVAGAAAGTGKVVQADGPPLRAVERTPPGRGEVAGPGLCTGSVCAGAHLPAAAGLLDGRSATTHWLTAAQPAHAHPEISVDSDAIFVRSSALWTCAGITSGMDMVAGDRGRRTAPRTSPVARCAAG
ncbi:hypothetical protein ACIQU4_05500 [Streptomyces sp. NPDC090741]|uniref:hypothetical protein n=1 Tax=Streptomyces sp. NPDC090741 TaxID=3365967 RepID=UPI0037FE7F08